MTLLSRRCAQGFQVVTKLLNFPCRRLAGPQWCQCWRLCFVFVSSQWFLHAGDFWRTPVLADFPGAIQCL